MGMVVGGVCLPPCQEESKMIITMTITEMKRL